MAHTQEEIIAELGQIVEEVTGIEPSEVTVDKSFVDDLDIDSLSMVEIAVQTEDKYGVKVNWVGDGAKIAGKVMGITLSATLQVLGGKVSGEATDPGFLLRDKALKYLRERFETHLSPSWNGQREG